MEPADRKRKAKLPPQILPTRPVEERVHDFAEIKLGFDAETAQAEADRCLFCPKQPCVTACPLDNDIPTAMQLIAEGKFDDAAAVYRQTSTMPEVCARVCPQDNLCEGACVLSKRGQPVALGALERFVSDYARTQGYQPAAGDASGKTVGVIGAGPAGLSAAYRLLEKGHGVTLYEAWPHAGGWLTYAIPTYKLPRDVVENKVADLTTMGAEFVYNTRVGKDITLQALREKHDAVFIGVGAMLDAQVRFEGKDLPGVYSGTDFLLPNYAGDGQIPAGMEPVPIKPRVVVFGGGDTAMDCVRTSVRLQIRAGMEPNVTLIYRRTEEEMPASHKERAAAKAEGVEFVYLAAPTAFKAGEDGRIKEVVIQRMELGEPDDSGRRRPVPIEGSEYTIETDIAVLALGYWPDPLLGEHEPDLETHNWGLVKADDETGKTNLPDVFAGGDAVRGPSLVSKAARDGIVAAEAIDSFLNCKPFQV